MNVYVREAHPIDGWRMASNDKDGVTFAQPTTDAERCEVAGKCCAALHMSIPLVVDRVDDRVGHAYSGMPDRLYLIDRDGKVAYKGGRGPFGFKPGELEQQIAMMLAEEAANTTIGSRFPVSSNEAALAKLSAAEDGANGPPPGWARVTAANLPPTTATILDLEDLHRTRNPLDPKPRAMVRWVVADANRCKYARRGGICSASARGRVSMLAPVALVLSGFWQTAAEEPARLPSLPGAPAELREAREEFRDGGDNRPPSRTEQALTAIDTDVKSIKAALGVTGHGSCGLDRGRDYYPNFPDHRWVRSALHDLQDARLTPHVELLSGKADFGRYREQARGDVEVGMGPLALLMRN